MAKVESFWNRGREIVNRLCAGSAAGDGRWWGRGWEEMGRLYEGNGAGDGRERSGCIVRSEKSL